MTLKKVTNDSLIADFQKLDQQTRTAFMQALQIFVEVDIGEETQRQVPVAKVGGGTLRRSWEVDTPVQDANGVFITFGYDTDYAVFVHEILDNFHEPPTKAKFLEDPVLEAEERIGEELLNIIDRILGVKT